MVVFSNKNFFRKGVMMSDLQSFYNSILNLRKVDALDKIKSIVLNQRAKLSGYSDDLAGFCKYIASQIEEELRKENITVYWVWLNDIVGVDHVSLIAEYRSETGMRRILIDPTYSQFTRSANKKLIGLKEWPSDKLDKNILDSLLLEGLVELDNSKFLNYLNSFGLVDENLSLESYLWEQKLSMGVRKR